MYDDKGNFVIAHNVKRCGGETQHKPTLRRRLIVGAVDSMGKQFMWLQRLSISILLTFAIPPCIAKDAALIDVEYKALNHYWIPSSADMPATMPPLVQSAFFVMQKNERIILDYEVTINSQGKPMDFEFKSITPSNIDPKPFIAMVMFYRYRPAAQNSSRSPVRVHGPMPFFTPQK